MVSGHRVDFFPVSRTVRVAWQRYDVERYLSLRRSQAAWDVMEEFAAEFSILADTQFAEFIRGGDPVSLYEPLQTYRDMMSQKAGKAPWKSGAPRSLSIASSATSQASSEVTGKDKEEGITAYKILKLFFDEHLPEWSKPREHNIELETYLLNEDGSERTDDDDKDAVDFTTAPAMQQFVAYSSMQGVTDSKGKKVDPPKPLKKGSLIPHLVSGSHKILLLRPSQTTGGDSHQR